MSILLRSGDWEAEIRPEAGGALSALRLAGVNVLRTMPESSDNPLDASCFPLAPYANRIRDAHFSWHGKSVQLPRNFAPESNSLHGLAWEKPWSVLSQAPFKCALEHEHDGETWPWAYAVEQRVRLGEKGLALSLDLTNLGDAPMPCGLGLHPYFRRRAETRVRFQAAGMLEVDKALIPTGEISPTDAFADWQGGTALPGETVDHCFAGWDGHVTIEDDLGTITMTARGAPFLHVYAPADGSALCFEPVSHPPDALNQDPETMTVLPAGCSTTLSMWISASG